ncbi:MAG: type II toxin-antitoxin system VapC family toxin [Treponema sp.]|nr:type II toxin-antitoxin system VapC family toxin [Treponema sp.]
MKVLLDTHILVWFHTRDSRLSEKAWDMLLDVQNNICYSSVNIWETQLKHLNHPQSINFSGEELNMLSLRANLTCLHIKPEHSIALKMLSYSTDAPRPHKDPFDKMLICQAKVENMLFMTHDSLIPYYNEPCILQV